VRLPVRCISWRLTVDGWLCRQDGGEDSKATRGLILVPTKELAEQVTQHLKQLTVYLDQAVTLANAASGTTAHLQRSLLPNHIPLCGAQLLTSRTIMSEKPDVVVATPSRILSLLQSKVRVSSTPTTFRDNFL
jgi:ATP-dependent RNA helicase DDX56/DBP9